MKGDITVDTGAVWESTGIGDVGTVIVGVIRVDGIRHLVGSHGERVDGLAVSVLGGDVLVHWSGLHRVRYRLESRSFVHLEKK